MEDAIPACKGRGADPKAIRLWHKLNDKTEICVKTGVGLTEYTEVGAVVGQGTMGGALVSQAVLDEGTKELFVPGDKNEINYGSVPMAPCLFQDDIIHGANDLEKARSAREAILQEKCSFFNIVQKAFDFIISSWKRQGAMGTPP